jgi:hypothetical protein
VVERCGGSNAEPASAVPRIRVRSAKGGGTRVELSSPSEPLAWAIDPSYDGSAPFDCVWHSERRPGARPVPAAKEATVLGVVGSVGVRVYEDDGSVGTVVHAP